jgi:hypothetical protein
VNSQQIPCSAGNLAGEQFAAASLLRQQVLVLSCLLFAAEIVPEFRSSAVIAVAESMILSG